MTLDLVNRKTCCCCFHENMAESSEYFSIGSIISCKTCHHENFKGEVLAFDPQTKMIVLKGSSSNGRTNCSDIHIINLSKASDVDVVKECTTPPPALPSLNIQKLKHRTKQKTEEKKRLLSALAAGVTPEGQSLFSAITKTLDEVTWNGVNIVVMNEVTITPPYQPENVKGSLDSKAVNHVRKIVEKHVKDNISPTVSPAVPLNQ